MVASLRVDDVFPETSHRHVAPSGSQDRFRPPLSIIVVVGRTVGIVVLVDPELVPPGFAVLPEFVPPGLIDGSAALLFEFCDRFKKMNKNALTTARRITATIM